LNDLHVALANKTHEERLKIPQGVVIVDQNGKSRKNRSKACVNIVNVFFGDLNHACL
jgi:hypothetical protein